MRLAPCCNSCSIMRRKRQRWSPWEIRIWPAIFPRLRITCVPFPTPRFRKWAQSKRSSGRFRFTAICPSPFQMLPSAARDLSARRGSPREVSHMRKTKIQTIRRLAFGCATLAVLSLAACSVNVKKEQNGEDKQVDIQTPVGGIHVSKGANVADVGLAVYPGARLKQKDSDGEDRSANVNISGLGFGLKVVALEYESDDSPAKLIPYYKDKLKKYGHVLECHTRHLDVNTDMKGSDHGSHELTCEGTSGSNIELKVGTKENQHIVSVEPDGKGSSFSLVYVRTHGKDADI